MPLYLKAIWTPLFGICIITALCYWCQHNSHPATQGYVSLAAEDQGARSHSTTSLSEDDSTVTRVGASPVCEPAERLVFLAAACSQEPEDDDKQRRIFRGVVVQGLLDHNHNTFYTLIPKAGSRSLLAFFASLVNSSRTIPSNAAKYRAKGIDYRFRMPITELNGRYGNYPRFIVVRHPLQRFVSAYFEVLRKRGKYRDAETCGRVRRELFGKPPESCVAKPLSFSEFSEAVSKEMLEVNQHWAPVHVMGSTCAVPPRLIMKTETIEHDTPYLHRLMGISSQARINHLHEATPDITPPSNWTEDQYHNHETPSQGHIGQDVVKGHTPGGQEFVFGPDLNKYDVMLKSLQQNKPGVFSWLLDFYSRDISAFGYTWDPERGASGCSYQNSTRGCC